MEVITTRHGKGKLATKTFFSDDAGFCVASVIVMGEKECVLLDCQWTLSNAHRVIAEIIETGLNLKAVFASHAHPDHYWGMGEIQKAFPNAKFYMLPEDCAVYNHQYQPKVEEWADRIGEMNLCRKQCENLLPLNDGYLELDGERIEVIPHVMGDLKWNSVVWIPSIKTLYGSDVLFNQAHPFTCEVTSEQRRQWIREIEKFDELGPEVVIPGHQKAGCLLDRSCMEFTKEYLIATEEELERTETAADFFYNMMKRFPDASGLIMLSNEMNAEVLKGGRKWDWNED